METRMIFILLVLFLYGRVDLSNQIQKSKVARWENKYLLTLTVQLNHHHHHHHHHHYYDRQNHHHHLQHQSHAIKITIPALFLMATKKWKSDTFSTQTVFTGKSFNLARSKGIGGEAEVFQIFFCTY